MTAPDTQTVRGTYATAATYRQSPDSARVVAFDLWLGRERAKARTEGWDACVSEGEACGHIGPHDAAELEARNPYRQEATR